MSIEENRLKRSYLRMYALMSWLTFSIRLIEPHCRFLYFLELQGGVVLLGFCDTASFGNERHSGTMLLALPGHFVFDRIPFRYTVRNAVDECSC